MKTRKNKENKQSLQELLDQLKIHELGRKQLKEISGGNFLKIFKDKISAGYQGFMSNAHAQHVVEGLLFLGGLCVLAYCNRVSLGVKFNSAYNYIKGGRKLEAIAFDVKLNKAVLDNPTTNDRTDKENNFRKAQSLQQESSNHTYNYKQGRSPDSSFQETSLDLPLIQGGDFNNAFGELCGEMDHKSAYISGAKLVPSPEINGIKIEHKDGPDAYGNYWIDNVYVPRYLAKDVLHEFGALENPSEGFIIETLRSTIVKPLIDSGKDPIAYFEPVKRPQNNMNDPESKLYLHGFQMGLAAGRDYCNGKVEFSPDFIESAIRVAMKENVEDDLMLGCNTKASSFPKAMQIGQFDGFASVYMNSK